MADDAIVASAEIHTTALRLRQARDAIAEWRKVETEARGTLLEVFASSGSDEIVTAGGDSVASLRRSERRGVNGKRLRAVYPEVWEDVVTETEVLTVDVPS